jgi:CheY-like chemotaxis protein
MDAGPSDGKKLLIIDDDDSLREVFEVTMEKAGYQVAGAADGLLGLAKAKVFKPHLIVLDLMMPKLDGFEVLRRLQSEGLGGIPVIVITGYSESASAQIVRSEPNVVEFLQKPIQYPELPALIARLLA